MRDKLQHGNAGIRRIGLFLPSGWEYCERLVEGVLRYKNDCGGVAVREFRYDARDPEDREKWSRRPRPWETWAPDGLIVSISADAGLREWVCAGGAPVINTGGSVKMRCVCVSPDGVAIKAIEHFKAYGYAHFAFVSQQADAPLWKAYQSRLKAMGIAPSHDLIDANLSRWDAFSEEQVSSETGLRDMLRRAILPVGILCENDDVGRAVCLATQRMGFKVPQEVGVLAVNNLLPSRLSVPPLSSIHAPGDQVGHRAMELILQLINGGTVPQRVEVPPGKVIVRQSTARRNTGEIDIPRIIQVMRDRACEGVGLEEILADLHVSESTLRREFARMIGRPPGEELARIRLERAEELLQTGTLSIEHVATATGYASQTNFTHFFKSQTGLTPREYRKRHAQGGAMSLSRRRPAH